MKEKIIELISRHQVIVSSSLIALVLISGSSYYYRDSLNLTASITAASCYLQPEIEEQRSDLAALHISASTTLSAIAATNADIIKNSESLTTVNAEITKIKKDIISEYSIQEEKAKVDALYNQLTGSKNLDLLYAQVQSASTTVIKARASLVSLNTQLSSAKSAVSKLLNSVNEAKKNSKKPKGSVIYKSLVKQYNSQVATFNSLNSKYKVAYTQLQSYITQYNTLNNKYIADLAQYKSTPAADLQKQYDTLLSDYTKLIETQKALREQDASLKEKAATYTALDTSLPEKVATLEAKSKDIEAQIADATNAIEINRANICPQEETSCSNVDENGLAIDDDRNGVANCDDSACAGDAACQVVPPDEDTTFDVQDETIPNETSLGEEDTGIDLSFDMDLPGLGKCTNDSVDLCSDVNSATGVSNIDFKTPCNKPASCVLLVVEGVKSDGKFNETIQNIAKSGNYQGVSYNFGATSDPKAQGARVEAMLKSKYENNIDEKILVAAHSLGAVATFNMKNTYGGTYSDTKFIYYDPPLSSSSFFIAIGSVFRNKMASAIVSASNNGIATSSGYINWTDGTSKAPEHSKFIDNSSALPEVKDWLDANCKI